MIRDFPLTPAQRKALDSQRNIAVTASAGSGKTATLVERYIELLLAHPDVGVRHVLAITFTQKAAAEMRDRVAARLRKALVREPDADQRQRLAAVYEDLPGARISTIHAFCAGLLREYPLEARVDPGFSVLEEVEAHTLRRETARQTLADLAVRPDGDADKEALRRLLQEWDHSYLRNVLLGLLFKKRLVRQWSRHYLDRTPEQLLAGWQATYQEALTPVCRPLLAPEFLDRLRALASLAPERNLETDTGEKRLAPARDAIQALLDDPGIISAVRIFPHLTAALTTSAGRPYSASRLGRKDNWDPDALDRMRQLLPEIGATLAPHADLFAQSPQSCDLRAAQVLQSLGRLFLQVDDRYARRKGQGARLDFDDLQERALFLLQADNGSVAARLARQYRFVMVDEFQDTDQLQWNLIRPLVSTHDQLDANKLFIVGDPKQSIYSFRDADVAVFTHVKEEMLAANQRHQRQDIPFHDDDRQELSSQLLERQGALVMAENFRTLAAPIAFVNHLFPQFMQTADAEPFQVGYDPLVCQRPDAAGPGSVELLLTPVGEEEEDFDSLLREAELIAGRLRHLFDAGDLSICDGDVPRPPRFGDVAILLRRRRFLPVYEQALRARQLPFQVLGGLGFYQRQEIYDLANLLRLLHNPRDSVALLGALRSPYFGLSDDALFALAQLPGGRLWDQFHARDRHPNYLSAADQRTIVDAIGLLERWSRLRDRVPLIELLHTLLEDTGAWGFLNFGERGDQNAANLHKILGLARSFAQAGPAPLADFVAYLDLLTAEEEKEGEAALDQEGDAIQILTVHASKGLEFPIVLVPDLDGEFNLRLSDAALVDREHGIGISILDPEQDFSRQPSFTRRLISGGHRRRAIAEEKRLFYVAATRARDHLLLSGRLRDHLEKPLSFEDARDRLSWVCRGLDLQGEDLKQKTKAFTQDDAIWSIRIHTDPDQFPSQTRQTRPSEPAFRKVMEELQPAVDYGAEAEGGKEGIEWKEAERSETEIAQESTKGESARESAEGPIALRALHPLVDDDFQPSFPVTEIVLFEQSPEDHYRRYILGLPLWDPTAEDQSRHRALLFGELAHALLEEFTLDPGQDPAACVDRLLLSHPLPDRQWAQPCRQDLLDLLEGFRSSPFGFGLLADSAARAELPFSLKLGNGVINGVIDRLFRGRDDQWELVDFKTTRPYPAQKANQAERHRRQLEIYALCLQQLYPEQSAYRATVYFTAIDDTHTFVFSPATLQKSRGEIEGIIDSLISVHLGCSSSGNEMEEGKGE